MKKLTSLFLLFVLSLFIISCQRVEEYVDTDTYSVVYDIKKSFVLTSNGYEISLPFRTPIYNSDVVLVYRQNGTSGGNPIWQQIPRTIYLSDGNEVDYDFDFTVKDIVLYVGATFDLATAPEYILNQTFRIVIVPASFGKSNVDFSDYNAVIKHFNIDDSKVKLLK